jgi:hypothetical protein
MTIVTTSNLWTIDIQNRYAGAGTADNQFERRVDERAVETGPTTKASPVQFGYEQCSTGKSLKSISN